MNPAAQEGCDAPTTAPTTPELGLATHFAHAGCEIDITTGALTPPIHFSSTFERDPDLGYSKGFLYARVNNPTRDLFERTMAKLEGGEACAAFASGQAAASAILQGLAGGHIIIPDDIYHGIRTVLRTTFVEWGLGYTEIDTSDLEAVSKALEDTKEYKTVVVWIETPSNPATKITDIQQVSELAHAYSNRLVCVDSTWVTPYITKPLALGADMVLHSVTKYLGGHSDLTGGCVVAAAHLCGEDGFFKKVKHSQCFVGGGLAPFDCWLTLRGIRSMGARMPLHCSNALHVAEFLEAHPKIVAVHYPGLPSHPGHAVAKKQMANGKFGGMLSFQVVGGQPGAVAMAANLKIFIRATSLGGTESLVEHRKSIEPADTLTPADLLRVSVGLEDIADLLHDLDQSLALVEP